MSCSRSVTKCCCLVLSLVIFVPFGVPLAGEDIPLPEHPRPDFEREDWLNLNGHWSFRFDMENTGEKDAWYDKAVDFPDRILVPFSWGSTLSGVEDSGDIGWYKREIQIPDSWKDKRVFLVVGACDWFTSAWLDGRKLGDHRGGYTPFEFEMTSQSRPGQAHTLALRVDDRSRSFKLEGKQGYGRAAGIWQTIYLEARPSISIQSLRFTPDIDGEKVTVQVNLDETSARSSMCEVRFTDVELPPVAHEIPAGKNQTSFDIPLENPRLWTLEDPYLYDVLVVLEAGSNRDRVRSYFGMRKISVENLPGTEDFRYIALNGKPVYLQMTLDQAYHPDGYYTFPSDDFMRDEILRTRRLGLNGQRIHVKIGIPRKLYWADRLGVLIMADIPNSWGEPDADMRGEAEYALRSMIGRDYNHPSIFSWVLFNETWGLMSGHHYTAETKQWVAGLYELAKKLDPTRLVEDNSANRRDHVATDINSWHAYLPGYAWQNLLEEISRDTYPGSSWNFAEGYRQSSQPNFNSECGNVWGYQGSTGDVDWSWDYHMMINAFRRHPKICGWLYTEHHDVINEWNGYYRYDRSNKITGLSDLVPDMSLRDLHGEFYIAMDSVLCRTVKPGETVHVPLFASFLTDKELGELTLDVALYGWDRFGSREVFSRMETQIPSRPWLNQELAPLEVTMPEKPALAVLSLVLKDVFGSVLHRNFTTYVIGEGSAPRRETLRSSGGRVEVIRFAPDSYCDARWSIRCWHVMDGLKVNGTGSGYFEYRIPWPAELEYGDIRSAVLRIEMSAKRLFGKDREDGGRLDGDFMRGKGTQDPSLNPNAYPMTDEETYPSAVRILVNGVSAGNYELLDDPADHRGILSWRSQKDDRKLREAGSYGQLISAHLPLAALKDAARSGEIVLRFVVDESLPGGLAVYGESFGRYPLDPTLLIEKRTGQ